MRYERDGFSVEAARAKGRPLPDDHWYHDRPDNVEGAAFFYAAYRDLVTCRVPDGPIPWTAAMAYADRKRFPEDIAEALWAVISRMDLVERQWRYDEMKREIGL